MNNRSFIKKALLLSVCLLILWAIMGTSTTIAWFTDSVPAVKNSFIIGEIDLDVFYKNDVITDYAPVDPNTSVFNDKALYEPGYTQVVYLKIENSGDIAFRYKLSVDRFSYVDSINTLLRRLHLPQYLRFGVLFSADEENLTRDVARSIADQELMKAMMLNQYSELDTVSVPAGGVRYAAMIVYMPEGVGNEANHMANAKIPTVELGLTIFAQQADAPLE